MSPAEEIIKVVEAFPKKDSTQFFRLSNSFDEDSLFSIITIKNGVVSVVKLLFFIIVGYFDVSTFS